MDGREKNRWGGFVSAQLHEERLLRNGTSCDVPRCPQDGPPPHPAVARAPIPGGHHLADLAEAATEAPSSSESPPCDFDHAVIKCTHCPDADRELAEVRLSNEKGIARSSLNGGRGWDLSSNPALEVCAGSKPGDGDTITVELLGGPGYTCAKNHPRITVEPEHGDRQRFEGETGVSFEALSRPIPPMSRSTLNPFAALRSQHFGDLGLNRYRVSIDACGVRDDGSPALGRATQAIVVYPSDEWSIALSTSGRFEGKWKGERSKTGSPRLRMNKEESGRPPSDFSLEIERNGVEEGSTSNLEDIIETIQQLRGGLEQALAAVADAPQVGWKLALELAFLEGRVAYQWAYREWKDHTVFRWWSVSFDTTIIAFELELSFGLGGKALGVELTAVVYGNISLDAGLQTELESTPDKRETQFRVTAEGKPELGIRAVLGKDWCQATGAVSCKFPFEGDISVGGRDPIVMDWRLGFSPLEAKVRGEVKLLGYFHEESWTWGKKVDALVSGRFPKATSGGGGGEGF